jgi:hypothetical protein
MYMLCSKLENTSVAINSVIYIETKKLDSIQQKFAAFCYNNLLIYFPMSYTTTQIL